MFVVVQTTPRPSAPTLTGLSIGPNPGFVNRPVDVTVSLSKSLTAPYYLDINWGDGTESTQSVSATVRRYFKKKGNLTVTVSVKVGNVTLSTFTRSISILGR